MIPVVSMQLKKGRPSRYMINKYIFCMLISVLCASVSQILLKKSALKSYNSFIREYLNFWVFGGYGLLFGSMLLTLYAYTGMDFKNGPVIESMGNILVPLFSFFVFKDKISARKCLGIAFIILGIIVFYA